MVAFQSFALLHTLIQLQRHGLKIIGIKHICQQFLSSLLFDDYMNMCIHLLCMCLFRWTDDNMTVGPEIFIVCCVRQQYLFPYDCVLHVCRQHMRLPEVGATRYYL